MDYLVAQYLEKLRLRLLDLSGRNRLLNFKFSERSRTQVRLVDELPDQIFEKLEKGTALRIAWLPEPPEHPTDEDDDAFRLLLETMRDADEEYMAAVASIDEADCDSEELQRIERELRDKVREELGMSPRTDIQSLSKTEYAKCLDINPDYDLPTLQSEEGGKPTHRDNDLQTLLYRSELERKLAGLREGARKSIQETGLNTLYLAFGMLEWYESDQSDKQLRAPLLLYPVTLERQLRSGQYYYKIKSFGEEPEENLSLKERLRHDYGMVLPTLTHSVDVDGEAADTPESYFKKVKHIIRNHSRWKVRRFLTLSLFSFGGIALYHDLNPERWSEESSILKHPLISSLLCGQEEVSQDVIASDYEVDAPTIANKVPLLITDADASQFSAIVDAIDGKNLVIEGPPGTGKSQTITNLIAATLAKGKKVLFVGEKKAALEVVYNRLADAGLENYCLEVHSTATSRQSFYEQLKRRVKQDPPSDVSRDLEDQINECSQLKQLLSRYVLLLNQPFGRIGKTIQELLWCAQRANDLVAEISLPSTLPSLRDDQAISMTAADFQRKCQHLKEFCQQHQELVQKYPQVENHPWFGLTAYDLSPIDQGDLLGSAKMWSSLLKQLQTSSQQLAKKLDTTQEFTLAELNQFQQQLEKCPEINSLIETALLPVLKNTQAQDSVTALIHHLKKYRKIKESLKQYFQHEIVSLPDLAQLKNLHAKLQTIELNGDKEYAITELKDLSERTTEVSKTIEQYKPIVTQVASFFDLDPFVPLTSIEAISTAVQILVEQTPETLMNRTAELCNPYNQESLVKAKATCEKLSALRDELEQKYYINFCENSGQMYSYANKLRNANFFKHLFDSEYRQAKKLWKKIQKRSADLSDPEIASIFEKIARFKEELNSFSKDSTLRRICGPYFRELETDFDFLISVNSFAINAYQSLTSSLQGHYIARFLLQADITKLEKISRLKNSQKFQSLMTFVDSLKLEEGFDEQKNWEELAVYYATTSSALMQIYEELTSFGLQSLMPISAIPNLIQGIENLNSEKQKINSSELINALGDFYKEEKTDIERLEATNNLAKSVVQSQLPQSLQEKLFTVDAVRVVEVIQAASQNLSSYLQQEAQHRKAFFQKGKPDVQAMFKSQDVTSLNLEKIAERIDYAVVASSDLPAWIGYHRAYQQVTDDGLQSLLEAFEHDQLALDNLEDVNQVVY